MKMHAYMQPAGLSGILAACRIDLQQAAPPKTAPPGARAPRKRIRSNPEVRGRKKSADGMARIRRATATGKKRGAASIS